MYEKMAPHTVGPWKIREAQDGRLLIDGSNGFVCTLDQPPGLEQQANARLIAAAPDLLAVCELFTQGARDAVQALKCAGQTMSGFYRACC